MLSGGNEDEVPRLATDHGWLDASGQLTAAGDHSEVARKAPRAFRRALDSTRTVAQWDYIPDDNAAFLEFHLRFKSGLRPECPNSERHTVIASRRLARMRAR